MRKLPSFQSLFWYLTSNYSDAEREPHFHTSTLSSWEPGMGGWGGGKVKRLKNDTHTHSGSNLAEIINGSLMSSRLYWILISQHWQVSAPGRSALLPAALCEHKGGLSKRQIVNGRFYMRGTIQALNRGKNPKSMATALASTKHQQSF